MNPEQLEDARLAKLIARGNDQALQTLYAKYLPQVYSFIARLSPSSIDPQDIVQDAFIKAWQQIKKYNNQFPFRTWLFTIARNTLRDAIRKKTPDAFTDIEQDEMPGLAETVRDEKLTHPDIELDRQWDAAVLEQAMNTLPLAQKELVLLHTVEDLTFQEIADAAKEPMDTVKTRYRRAILKLRDILTSSKKDLF